MFTRKKLFIGLGTLFLLAVLGGAAYWMTISWIKIRVRLNKVAREYY